MHSLRICRPGAKREANPLGGVREGDIVPLAVIYANVF